MSCGITYDKNGNIVSVVNEQGLPSTLYKQALNATKDETEAKRIFLVSKTPSFKQDVVQPDIKKYQAEIFSKLAEFKHNIPNLKYNIVKTKGYETIQQIVDKRVVGRIRLKQTTEGYKVDSTLVQPDYQGKGLGTDLYKQAIKYAFKNEKNLLSDNNQTEDAQRVWEKLADKQIAQPKLLFQKTLEQTAPQITQEIIDKLKQTGLSEDVFLLSTEEIDTKLKELGVSEDLRKQVIAYHGSPHAFNRFTTEKMGTGEGVQAFGWGLYFTDLKSIAKDYAEKLGVQNGVLFIDGKEINSTEYYKLEDEVDRQIFTAFTSSGKFRRSNINVLEQLKSNKKNAFNKEWKDIIQKSIDKFQSDKVKIKAPKNLYKVSLHKGKTPSEYTWLEWDTQTAKEVKEKFSNVIKNENLKGEIHNIKLSDKYDVESFDGGKTWKVGDTTKIGTEEEFVATFKDKKEAEKEAYKLNFVESNITGKDLYEALAKQIGQKEASIFLLENGIDGIKYLAESISRGATSDTARGFNYVVFDENAITIEEQIQFQKAGINLITNGFTYKDKNGKDVVILNKDTADDSTLLHEFGHIFSKWIKENKPDIWQKGQDLTKNAIKSDEIQEIVSYVKQTQPNLKEGSEAFYDEVLQEFIGRESKNMMDEQKTKSPLMQWLSDFWASIKDMLGLTSMTPEQVANLSLREFARASVVDLLSGKGIVQNSIQQAIQRNNGNPLNLAPNGKPSILYQSYKDLGYSDSEAERLVAQVYSDEFLTWFGDWVNDPENASKVVDENGEPLVVYHGTNADFEEFVKSKIWSNIVKPTFDAPDGFYFSKNKIISGRYGKKIKEVFIGKGNILLENSKIIVVDNPNQIKSATENIGTFSTETNDIRYRKSEQEYPLKDVYNYIQAKTYEGKNLNKFEIEEAKNVMLVNNIEDSTKLLEKLTKAFIVNDIFKPTIQSLKTFYSDFEIKKVFEDLGIIRSFYYRLKNTEPFTNDNVEADKRFIKISSFETDSLGKVLTLNPLIEQEKFRQEFGGIKDETVFEDKSLYEQYSKLNRVPVVDKNNQQVSKNKTKEFLEITLKDDSDGSFRRMNTVLLNTPSELWNDSDVSKLKEKIFQKAIQHSLDLKSFTDLNEKDAKELLSELNNTFETSNFEGLAQVYDKVFSVDISPRQFVTKDKRPVVKLYEKENDFNLFKKFGFLPLGDRVYLKTDANEKSYQEVKDILGEPDIKMVKSIDLEGAEDVDIETMQKMALYAKRFNTLLEDNTQKDKETTDEFYSDIHREYLKDKNNPKYENIIFTEKGFDYYINKEPNRHNKPKIFTGNYYKISENEIQADEIVDVIRTQEGILYYPTSNNVYSTNKEDYRNNYEPIVNNQPVEIKKGRNNLDCE